MKKIILFTILLLSFCSILILSVYIETPDEDLAYRMSRSESFAAVVKYGEHMANLVDSLPDRSRDKLRQSKKQIEEIQNTAGMNISQKKDSLIKVIKAVSISNPGFMRDTSSILLFHSFYKEFPEYKSLSQASKKSVFKKAFEMFRKNSGIYM